MRSDDRVARVQRDAEALIQVHDQVSKINDLGVYTDLLDHIARKLRLTREQARMLSDESKR